MAAPSITLPAYGNFGGFIVREANGYRSREQITLADTAAGAGGAAVFLEDGAVLGRVTASGSYVLLAPAASDGSQTAAAILLGRYRVDDGAKKAAVVNADCEVQRARLVFGAGATDPQKTAAYAALAAQGIKFR